MSNHDPREVLDRPAPPPDRTVAYGPGPEHVVDVRRPPGPTDRPLVIVIHGGFWRAEYDRAHVGPLSADLAARGYPVATIEYRRTGAPGGGWPGTLDDVAEAVARTPGLLDRDGERPVLLGHSAGGHLALWAAGRAPDRVAGVVALAPVADLAEAYRRDLDGGAVAALLGGGPEEYPDRYAAAEPYPDRYPSVPTVIVHGDQDRQVPVEIGRGWARAAAAHGAPVSLRELSGVEHFGLIDPLSSAWPAVLGALDALTLGR